MSFGAPELLIVLAISALLFGTKKIRSLGGDLGGALRGFRKAMNEEDASSQSADSTPAGTDKANENEEEKGKST